MPTEYPKGGFFMTIGKKLTGSILGIAVGGVLTVILLYNAEKNGVVYTLPPIMKLLLVVIIATCSCIIVEAFLNTSAREIAVDIYIAVIVSLLTLTPETISGKSMQSAVDIMAIVSTTVVFAAWYSNPISRDLDKLFKIEISEKRDFDD